MHPHYVLYTATSLYMNIDVGVNSIRGVAFRISLKSNGGLPDLKKVGLLPSLKNSRSVIWGNEIDY